MKRILLPNNNLGGCIMLLALALIITVPFAITMWLVSMVAPWWVSIPSAALVALVAVLFTVKFKQ